MAEPATKLERVPEPDIEADLDAAIEACGGDMRAALRATLVANVWLDAEVDRLTALVSAGLVRGRVRKKAPADDVKPSD